MQLIWKYLKPYKLRVFVGLIIKIIGTLADLAIPYLLSHIVDEIMPTKDLRLVTIYGLIMIGAAVICFLFNMKANQMASYICKLFTTSLRHDLFEKINTLTSSQFDEVTMPTLISRMTSDTYNVHQMVGMMQRIGVRAPLLLLGGIVITFFMDPVLTLVLIALLPFILLITYFVTKHSIPLFTKVQESADNMVREIRENITGIRVIKALSKVEYEKEKFNKVNKEVMNYELKAGFTMARLSPIMNVLLNMGLVLVVIFGAIRVSGDQIGVGKVISFTTYFTLILSACLTLTRVFVVFSRSTASANRIDYVLKLPVLLNKECGDENDVKSSEYFIEFNNVSFKYVKSNKEYVLSNINFKLKKGETLGIIGPTGCGKTTIINLLMRFYDVSEGEILVNGINVKNYEKEELRKLFGTSFQNDTIFTDTILNNVKFDRDISDLDVIKACETSLATDFIKDKENTYNYQLSQKGTNISGGQKQRIFIARALAASPEILILDDATSALDYKTDSLLRQNIKKNYGKITSIVIAQRISSVINSDYIMVLEDGMMLGYGKHDYLMNTVAEYKEIYTSQMGGVNNE